METTTYSEFEANGATVYQKTTMSENSVNISQSHLPFKQPEIDDEVTHGEFFGENIKRVRKIFKGC